MKEKTELPQNPPHPGHPGDHETHATACNYCVVGCGYRVHSWDPGTGHSAPPSDLHCTWMSPAWIDEVEEEGRRRVRAIVPDPQCPVNRGNHSIRGGTMGRDLTCQDVTTERASTRERLTTPMIRLADDQWHPLDWPEALELMRDLIVAATQEFKCPRRVGAKVYGYHSLENTFAAMTLLRRVIGTPNVADHDRPSTASSSPGLTDAGIHHHAFAYDDLLDCDVVFLLGSNAYECQSVFFQQSIAGRRLVVLDPRRTITADYAVRTGGLHLQPNVLGADCRIVHAIARIILDEHHGEREIAALRRLVSDAGAKQRRQDAQGRAALRIQSFDEWADEIRGNTSFDPDRVAHDTGLALEDLRTAAALLANPNLRSAILYEKGLIWGFNYANTAAVANLAILTFNFNAPNRPQDEVDEIDELLGDLNRARGFCGRLGGHQKGFAKPKDGKKDLMHPDATATDWFVSDREEFLISNYQDHHLAGTVAYAPPPGSPRIDFRYPEADDKHPEDISLFWVVGCNPAGDIPDAQAKWQRIAERQAVGRGEVRSVQAAKEQLLARVQAVDAEGLRGLVIVQQDIHANYTTEFADLLLPAAGFGEDPFTRYNGERRLRLYDRFQASPLHREEDGSASSRCWPDWKIFTAVAQELEDAVDSSRRAAIPRWNSSAEIFDELSAEGASNRSDWLTGLGVELERAREIDPQATGHDLLRRRGTRGLQLPFVVPDDGSTEPRETKTLRHDLSRGPFFVSARWCDVSEHFDSLLPRDGEVWLTNGRVNEAWNSMAASIRNDVLTERYPDDWPGTLLEVNPEWATERELSDGDVVEVRRADDRHFVGVISCQESVPQGGAFALFSFPCNERTLGPLKRKFHGHGYANNVADGFVDPTGPIAANKYGRAAIIPLRDRPRVALPTTARRHVAFDHHVGSGDPARWRARELLVSRGLPRIHVLQRDDRGNVVVPAATHGAFWRTTHSTRDAFVRKPLLGQFRLIKEGDAQRSLLIEILEGRAALPQMPLRAAPLPWHWVQHVRRWIDDGCPTSGFADIRAILDFSVRIHGRVFGSSREPAETLMLDPDWGIDALRERAGLFLDMIRPQPRDRPSPMCWRNGRVGRHDNWGRVLSEWTAAEYRIFEDYLSRGSTPTTLTYSDICDILDESVRGAPVMALHGSFWQRLSRDQFVAHRVLFAGGEIPVVRLHDGENSALVHALRGTGPFENFRMPAERQAIPQRLVAQVVSWIDHGCP